jgi:hypothetical protein
VCVLTSVGYGTMVSDKTRDSLVGAGGGTSYHSRFIAEQCPVANARTLYVSCFRVCMIRSLDFPTSSPIYEPHCNDPRLASAAISVRFIAKFNFLVVPSSPTHSRAPIFAEVSWRTWIWILTSPLIPPR